MFHYVVANLNCKKADIVFYLIQVSLCCNCNIVSLVSENPRLVDECADYCRTCDDDVRPEAHQVFYSGCQV